MKKLLLILLVSAFASCNPEPEGGSIVEKNGDFVIKTIDSCEYIEYDYGYGNQRVYSLTHKGNCKYCAARSSAPVARELQGKGMISIDTVKGEIVTRKIYFK